MRFLEVYPVDEGLASSGPYMDRRAASVEGYASLMGHHAGRSFGQGTYRLHGEATAGLGRQFAEVAFPSGAPALSVFGYDWLGRQFALDFNRIDHGEPQVALLEPGTGEVLEIPATFAEFHQSVLVDMADAAVAVEFFGEWASANHELLPLAQSECVGYVRPLFLGGNDDTTNLQVQSIDVYWHLAAQLIDQTRDLPPGARVSGVDLN